MSRHGLTVVASAKIHYNSQIFCPPTYGGGAMRARARERRLRASERPAGGVGGARGELAAKTRPPGRVPGAAVRLLGARASAPVGNRGGVRPLGRTVGPVAPDPAAKTRNARRAGGCGPCPVDNLWQHGNMATWQHGNMASWHRGIG